MGGSLLKLFFIKSHLQNTVRQGAMEEKNDRLVRCFHIWGAVKK